MRWWRPWSITWPTLTASHICRWRQVLSVSCLSSWWLSVNAGILHVIAAFVPFFFTAGDTVVVCVNNLGALSSLEMAVVTRAAIICLGNHQWIHFNDLYSSVSLSFCWHVPSLLSLMVNYLRMYWNVWLMVSTLTESRGMVVARVMCGSFMTSLEMAGVSLTLMRADPDTLRLFGGQT